MSSATMQPSPRFSTHLDVLLVTYFVVALGGYLDAGKFGYNEKTTYQLAGAAAEPPTRVHFFAMLFSFFLRFLALPVEPQMAQKNTIDRKKRASTYIHIFRDWHLQCEV